MLFEAGNPPNMWWFSQQLKVGFHDQNLGSAGKSWKLWSWTNAEYGHMVISCRWISPYSRILNCAARDFPSFCRNWRDESNRDFSDQTYEIHKEIVGGSPILFHPLGSSAMWFSRSKNNMWLRLWIGVWFGRLAQLCSHRKCPKPLQCLRPGAGNADLGL